jgi:uncharacterized protein YdaL
LTRVLSEFREESITPMSNTLVLYDTSGQWGWLGELYAIMTANLVSYFGTWTALPVSSYTVPGRINTFSAVIYIGSSYGEPIPKVFLADVLASRTSATAPPIIWIYDNIWSLTASDPNFFTNYGWIWSSFDTSQVAQVTYKGRSLSRYAGNAGGIMNYFPFAYNVPVTTLASAVKTDGTTFPWAVRSFNLTYIGENPLVYMAEGDRYLAFCDLLFDALAPKTVTRHRALVRLEDLDPMSDPAALMAAADYLKSVNVPFGFQVAPLYKDPLGVYGTTSTLRLKDSPDVVAAFKYLQSKGGVMINHGYTHQYTTAGGVGTQNPYTGASGDDCEFFRLTLNADESINYVGPVPEDNASPPGSYAQGRITSSRAEFTAAGFTLPAIWTFPGYFGSADDIKVIGKNFAARAERSLYYSGTFSGAINVSRYCGQFFPYVVKDVYGTTVLPDTLGGISPTAFYSIPPRLPDTIIAAAEQTLVVRDGFASFFFNPGDDISFLQATVDGIMKKGYTFVGFNPLPK